MDKLKRIDGLLARIVATARDARRDARAGRIDRFEFKLIVDDAAEARELLAEVMACPGTEARLRLLAADSIEAEVAGECREARGSAVGAGGPQALARATVETLQASGVAVMGLNTDWSMPFMLEKCR
jgi:hypothetical protein